MILIGIDIAKYDHVVSIIDSLGEVLLEPLTFKNNRDGFDLLSRNIEPYKSSKHIVGLEATGHYGDNLIDFLVKEKYFLGLINPLSTDAYRKINLRKTKNDKIDSLAICRVVQAGYFTHVTQKLLDMRALKQLTRYHTRLTQDQSRLKVIVKGCLDIVFPEYAKEFSDIHGKTSTALLTEYTTAHELSNAHLSKLTNLLNKNSRGRFKKAKAIALKKLAQESVGINDLSVSFEIKQTVTQIQLLENQIKEVKEKIDQLCLNTQSPIFSIPGIGPTTGPTILSEIGDINNFDSPRKLLAFAGCDPSVYQSGTYNSANNKISKRGSPHLRNALYQAAFNVSCNEPTFHKYYTLKRSQGKGHRNALGHVVHKLIRVIFKLLTEDIQFDLEAIK